MRSGTVLCYFFSLLSFGMGYSKMLVYTNAIANHANTYDYTRNLSLATSFLVLAIFFAVSGFALYAVTIMKAKEIALKTITKKKQSTYSGDSRYSNNIHNPICLIKRQRFSR